MLEPHTIADSELRPELERAIGAPVAALERRPSEYQTSFTLEELDVRLENGDRLELMLKDVSPNGLQAGSRIAKPEFLYDPLREIEAYRDVLGPLSLGTPTLYLADPEHGLLVIERVPGVELFQVGSRATWEHVARWLARMHRELGPATASFARAIRYDREYFVQWPARALRFAELRGEDEAIRVLRALSAAYETVVARLLDMPRTLVHGEFYASNVLVDDPDSPDRVAPVDWEQVAAAPALVDLAALTSGGWPEADRAAIAAAYREAAGDEMSDSDFAAGLVACRLHVALQWLGWSLEWVPPGDHRQDWLKEATDAAGVLGLDLATPPRNPAAARALRPITRVQRPVVESEQAFDFIVTGDSRPTLPNAGFPRVTHRLFEEIRLLQPAFVLFTGDFMWGYNASRQEMLNDIDRFRALADTTGVPLFNMPGNHEMLSDPRAVDLLEQKGHDLYGSFDVGPYHFIGLNTDEFCLEGRVAGEQLDWLRRDLEQNRDATAIFVFMHRPMHSWFQGDFNPDDQQMLHELFAEFPVHAVFAAHDHFFHFEEHDGVRYMTVAGAGSPMYAQPTKGGYAHYVIVSLLGDGAVDYNVVEPGRLDVQYVAGNDGIEPLSIARVANTTDRDLTLRKLDFQVPRLATPADYDIRVDWVDWARQPQRTPAQVTGFLDREDGSATLSVAVTVPTGVAFRVVVEARY